jgi:hypothetical protein
MSHGDKLPLACASAPDFFATELVAIEDLGQCARLVFAVPRQVEHQAYREVVVQVIVPQSILAPMARQLSCEPVEIKNGNPEADRVDGEPEPMLH